MIHAFGDDMDEAFLRMRLKQESAEDAYELLRSFADRTRPFSARDLEHALDRLQERTSGPEEDT